MTKETEKDIDHQQPDEPDQGNKRSPIHDRLSHGCVVIRIDELGIGEESVRVIPIAAVTDGLVSGRTSFVWHRRIAWTDCYPDYSWTPLRGVRDQRSPELLASTTGVGVLAIRRGGAEREKPSGERVEHLAMASMHDLNI
ncbi:MAG: hypothetical protein CAF45_015240 [Nitrospira sp. CG24E]|nr:MAG: hypothetical protein CAF45_015240 [Nitrospira sp. CG24E]